MTLIEELKALDLACGEPDNIYKRVLDYTHKLKGSKYA